MTSHTYHNVYSYARFTLWLSYGLAILVAGLAVLIGLFCISLNGASFSHDFSTVLRTTRNAELSVEMKDEDNRGRDPLPKYLADAEVVFDQRRDAQHGSVEEVGFVNKTTANRAPFRSQERK